MGKINELYVAGFTTDEIMAYYNKKSAEWLGAGFSQAEIDEYFGRTPDPPESYVNLVNKLRSSHAQMPTELKQAHKSDTGVSPKIEAPKNPEDQPRFVMDKVRKAAESGNEFAQEALDRYTDGDISWQEMLEFGPIEGLENFEPAESTIGANYEPMVINDLTVQEAIMLGYQTSVTGLATRNALPSRELPARLTMLQRLGYQASMVAGDVPFMAMGAVLGLEGGPVTSTAGAFALPAGIRKVLIDKYENGNIETFGEFWERLQGAVIETSKAWTTGAATGGVKGVPTKIITGKFGQGTASQLSAKAAELATEVSTMTTVGALMEGHIPSKEEFIDAAVLLGGLKVAHAYKSKLMRIYQETARRPVRVIRDANLDPTIKEDLLSVENVKPRAYGGTSKYDTSKYTSKEAFAKVKESISVGEKGPSEGPIWHRMYTYWVNKYHPLRYLAKVKRNEITESELEAQNLIGSIPGKAEHFINHGTLKIDGKYHRPAGEPIGDIVKELGSKVEDFRAYAVAKRALELEHRKIDTGVDLDAAATIIAHSEALYRPYLNRVLKYNADLFSYLRDSGMMSKAQYERANRLNKYYVPFKRVMDETSVSKVLAMLKGSEKKIIDPIESVIKNTYDIVQMAERNRVNAIIAKQFGVRVAPFASKDIGGFERTLADLGKVSDSNTISVYRNGKRIRYKVNPAISKLVKGLDSETAMWAKYVGIPASMLRAGAVLTPEFMLRNPIRDQFMAHVYSKNGYIFGYDMLRGLGSLLRKDDYYKEWIKSGGANATLVSMDRNYMQGELAKLYDTPVRNIVKTPADFLKVMNNINPFRYPRDLKHVAGRLNPIPKLRYLSDLSESSTRLGEFRRARQRGLSLERAGYASREVTQDFMRMGAGMKSLNTITAFLNAQIQGMDKLAREIYNYPKETLTNLALTVTMPSVLLAMMRNDIMVNSPDSEMAKALREVPDWQRHLFWIIPGGDGVIYRIPKPFEVGILFGSVAEEFIDYTYIENTSDAKHFLQYAHEEGLINTLFDSVIPDVMPTMGTPIVETWANKSQFTGQPIIPAYLERVLPELQYTTYTSKSIRLIAHQMNKVLGTVGLKDTPHITSPIIIQNAIRAWSGGLGQYALQVMDEGLKSAGIQVGPEYEDPEKTLSDIPVIKAFVVRYPSANTRSIGKFFDEAPKIERNINSIKLLMETEPDNPIVNQLVHGEVLAKFTDVRVAMSKLFKLIRMTSIDPDMKGPEKRQAIEEYYKYLISIAQEGNIIIRDLKRGIKESQRD